MIGHAEIELRNLRHSDYAEFRSAMDLAYAASGVSELWSYQDICHLLDVFPQGQLCAEHNGRVVGTALSVIVRYDDFGDRHTYQQIVADNVHNPRGDVLYGVEIVVHPEFRGMGVGHALYQERKRLCNECSLRAILLGGRIPGYTHYAASLSADEYVGQVIRGDLTDPVLTFQLRRGFVVKGIVSVYLSEDSESQGYAALLEWKNWISE